MPLPLNLSLQPYLLIQPICFAGFPTNKAKSGTLLVTTAPAPIKAYSPISWPHTIVAFAPIEAPLPTWVRAYSLFLFTAERGLITFVKTQEGPKNTSLPQVTPV